MLYLLHRRIVSKRAVKLKMEKALTIREQRKIETDNKILRATISLIGEKGYKATSIRERQK